LVVFWRLKVYERKLATGCEKGEVKCKSDKGEESQVELGHAQKDAGREKRVRILKKKEGRGPGRKRKEWGVRQVWSGIIQLNEKGQEKRRKKKKVSGRRKPSKEKKGRGSYRVNTVLKKKNAVTLKGGKKLQK